MRKKTVAGIPSRVSAASFALIASACLQPDMDPGKLRTIKYWHQAECGGAAYLSDSINARLEHVFIDSTGSPKKSSVSADLYAGLEALVAAADLQSLNARNVPVSPDSCISTRECRRFNHLTLEYEDGAKTYSDNQRCVAYDSAYLAAFASVASALEAARNKPSDLPVDTCSGIRDTLLPERTLLLEQWKKWKSRSLLNYSFEFRQTCFCMHAGTWFRIIVLNGKAAQVQPLSEGRPGFPAESAPTLDSLFFDAARELCRGSEVKAAYDDGSGHMTRLDVDLYAMPYDGGFTWEVKNLVPIFNSAAERKP